MTAPVTAFVALGSNLGDRAATIRSAIDRLHETPGVTVTAQSTVIETDPLPPGQPSYLNACVALETNLTARELLNLCLTIERDHGRTRDDATPRWSPRTLDLDLLLYGNAIIDEPGLRVPHPRLHERAFVLQPLAELAPAVRHPMMGRSIESLLNDLSTAIPID